MFKDYCLLSECCSYWGLSRQPESVEKTGLRLLVSLVQIVHGIFIYYSFATSSSFDSLLAVYVLSNITLKYSDLKQILTNVNILKVIHIQHWPVRVDLERWLDRCKTWCCISQTLPVSDIILHRGINTSYDQKRRFIKRHSW